MSSKIKYLKQNSKMIKSSTDDAIVYNFGIPAYYSKELNLFTCPNAKACISGCYARSGTYNFSNVVKVYTDRLKLVLSDKFTQSMIDEIETLSVKHKGRELYIRIHDSGDFFNQEYLDNWVHIMKQFKDNSMIKFYTYTKMVSMFKSNQKLFSGLNFHYVFSLGGKEDHLVDQSKDHHVKVFETLEDSKNAGYVDVSKDDLITAKSKLNMILKLSIVYHGNKKYSNTNWEKVV